MFLGLCKGTDGTNRLLIGLSRENVKRLTEGKPIDVNPQKHPGVLPDGWSIGILFGETEMAILAELKKLGVIGPETIQNIDPRLK